MAHFFWRTEKTFIEAACVPETETERFKENLLKDESILAAYYVEITPLANGLKQRTHHQIKVDSERLKSLNKPKPINRHVFF